MERNLPLIKASNNFQEQISTHQALLSRYFYSKDVFVVNALINNDSELEETLDFAKTIDLSETEKEMINNIKREYSASSKNIDEIIREFEREKYNVDQEEVEYYFRHAMNSLVGINAAINELVHQVYEDYEHQRHISSAQSRNSIITVGVVAVILLMAALSFFQFLNKVVNMLEVKGTFDGLTKLYNKNSIIEMLDKEISKCKELNTELSICVMDIDKFKDINDTHGHIAGDLILKDLADVLREITRTYDVIGRFGGEEFIVMMLETNKTDSVQAAERIRKAVEEHSFIYEKIEIPVTISIGVAQWEGEKTPSELIEKADKKLYEAKNSGRNRICV